MQVVISELARIRRERGLSQTDLARLLGVAQPTLSCVENGHVRAWPKLRRDAAKILHEDEGQLFPEGLVPRPAMEVAERP